MSSSYLTPFPNLTFKTAFVASSWNNDFRIYKSVECQIIAAFAVTSTTFFNSSFQANVVSRMEINDDNMKLVDLFLLTSATTSSSNLSTIQMTPVLHLNNFSHPDTFINTLKNSTYFTRSLKCLTVRNIDSCRVLPALENLVALEVLDLDVVDCKSKASEQDLSVIARLPSLIQLDLAFGRARDIFESFDFLGDLENNNSFRKLTIELVSDFPRNNFRVNLARLCANNLLTHFSFSGSFVDEHLDVLIDANLTHLRSLTLKGGYHSSFVKIADAIIASSSSLTMLHVDEISDDVLIKCAEHLDKLVELRLTHSSVNGYFLREKGSCFARLEIFDVSYSCLSDRYLKDGFQHLTALRKLNVSYNQYYSGAKSLQYLTAATSLEELKLGEINGECLKAVGQLTQLRILHVEQVDDDVKREDVIHLKSLVNLRKLTFYVSSRAINDGIFKIAHSFQKLEYIKLAFNVTDKANSPKVSRDQVAYLLEKCWPLVRYAVFEYDDPSTAMPYLRQRFPHVSFGDRDEEVARKNGALISPSSNVPAHRPRSP